MNTRRGFAFLAVIFSLLFLAPIVRGQGRGMRGSSAGFRSGSSFRTNRGRDFNRRGERGFENGFGFPFFPFFYADDYPGGDTDYNYSAPDVQPAPPPGVQAQPPAPAPPPGDTLILENHDGQWVRIPTGAELLNGSLPVATQSSSAANSHAATEAAITEASRPALPPAVLVFRDGHSEEIQKYVIHGTDLYAAAAYSATGSWTKKIPLADLDIPASLRINKDRGTKFNLPSGPNEVVIRF